MRLNARSSDDEARQLEALCAAPSRALGASGFIGCASADPELSATYHDTLRAELERKRVHR